MIIALLNGVRREIVRAFNRLYSRLKAAELFRAGRKVRIAYPTHFHGAHLIEVGDKFSCGPGGRLEAFGPKHDKNPRLIIGNGVSMEKDCHIGAANRITIADNVMIASRVYISDHSHGEITAEALDTIVAQRPIVSKGPVTIGRNVWLGEGVIVLPGVTIGECAIVGAGAVVTHDIPPRAVAAGNPARIIKQL